LVLGLDVVEARERHGVLHARVVRVERDDVRDAHARELPQRERAVQRFAVGVAVLAAFVEHRHDDGDALGLAVDGGEDALEVAEVVVGAHTVHRAAHGVGDAVVERVGEKEDVLAADRVVEHALRLPRGKARAQRVDCKRAGVFEPFFEVKFHFPAEFFDAFHENQNQIVVRHSLPPIACGFNICNARRATRHMNRITQRVAIFNARNAPEN